MKVTALIPAYNEEKWLPLTLAALRSRPEMSRVIVIDDGSTDGTVHVAREAGADEVVTLAGNRGKGAALTEGARLIGGETDIVLLLDADLGSSATEFVKLLGPVADDEADMTIGMLPPDPALLAAGRTGGGSGVVVRLARGGLYRRTGIEFAQPLSGQRAMKREVLAKIGGQFASGFGVEVALTLSVVSAGFRIKEVETAFRHRVTGNGWADLLHRGRQFADVVHVLLR
ncbi:MAG: glycosyltransferase family 2 protein [Capsulimonadaceae bacterium]|nr:glycosyltransferase family 2 protein [Capsulimonadaceae bacterium]